MADLDNMHVGVLLGHIAVVIGLGVLQGLLDVIKERSNSVDERWLLSVFILMSGGDCEVWR